MRKEAERGLIERDDIVLWRIKYLNNIVKLRSEGRTIYYTDETWLNEGHTMNKICQDHTIKTERSSSRGIVNRIEKPKWKREASDSDALQSITAESWKRCIDHVMKEEQKMLKLDGIVDDVVDKVTIKVGGSSSSESSDCE
ncbi:hypothetical protein evm_013256 [Chilo suppressalis]|nr:hypothetical protein evm_013256 [Chilo suppressalis]